MDTDRSYCEAQWVSQLQTSIFHMKHTYRRTYIIMRTPVPMPLMTADRSGQPALMTSSSGPACLCDF